MEISGNRVNRVQKVWGGTSDQGPPTPAILRERVSDFGYAAAVRLFRAGLSLFDRRRIARTVSGKTPIDVGMIANLRDMTDVRNLGYHGRTPPDSLPWVRMYLDRIGAQMFMIGSVSVDLLSREGIRKAQTQFLKATEASVRLGARVVALTAGTKRLFGRDASELKGRFPGVLFTIGDNFTALTLREEVIRVRRLTGLADTGRPRILIIGPSGHLGKATLSFLLSEGMSDVVCLGSDEGRANNISREFGIEVCTRFEDVGPVDMVVACNHVEGMRLRPDRVGLLRRPGSRPLVLVDVCEPYNMDEEAFAASEGSVIRFDANAYSVRLRFVLGRIAASNLRLAPGVVWPCFAESMILAKYAGGNPALSGADWMNVTPGNQQLLRPYFGKDFGLPIQPLNFGKEVTDNDIGPY